MITPKELAAICAFVQQDDILLSTSTVRETLQFSGFIRQSQVPSDIQQHSIAYHIEHIINDLELMHVADQQIGDVMNSGNSAAVAVGGLKKGSGLSGKHL